MYHFVTTHNCDQFFVLLHTQSCLKKQAVLKSLLNALINLVHIQHVSGTTDDKIISNQEGRSDNQFTADILRANR